MATTFFIIVLVLWNIINTTMIFATLTSIEKYIGIIDEKIGQNKEDIKLSDDEIKDLYDKTKKDEDKLNRVIDLIIDSEKEKIRSKGFDVNTTSTILCNKLEDLRK